MQFGSFYQIDVCELKLVMNKQPTDDWVLIKIVLIDHFQYP